MSNEEISLLQFIWQRMKKHAVDPPGWAVGEQKAMDALARNWLTILRTGLLTIAAFLTLQAYPPDFTKAWQWLKENLPGHDRYSAQYLAALLALVAIQGH